jgi:hypothetical protein
MGEKLSPVDEQVLDIWLMAFQACKEHGVSRYAMLSRLAWGVRIDAYTQRRDGYNPLHEVGAFFHSLDCEVLYHTRGHETVGVTVIPPLAKKVNTTWQSSATS